MLRAIYQTPTFETEIEALREDYPRIDEVKTGIKWGLGKVPQYGERLPRYPNHRIFLTFPIGPMPPFKVLYEYNPGKDPGVVRNKSIAPPSRDIEF